MDTGQHDHRLGRAAFMIDFPSEQAAFEAQPDLDTFVRETLLPVMESVFDEFGEDGRVYRLARLELDLGAMPYDGYRQEMALRLRQRLRDLLLASLPSAESAPDSNATILERDDARLALVTHFLETGQLPWHAGAIETADLEGSLLEVLEHRGPALANYLRHHPTSLRETLLARLVNQFTLATLGRLALLLANGSGTTAAVSAETCAMVSAQLTRAAAHHAPGSLLASHPQRSGWVEWLDGLAAGSFSGLTPRQAVDRFLAGMARRLGVPPPVVRAGGGRDTATARAARRLAAGLAALAPGPGPNHAPPPYGPPATADRPEHLPEEQIAGLFSSESLQVSAAGLAEILAETLADVTAERQSQVWSEALERPPALLRRALSLAAQRPGVPRRWAEVLPEHLRLASLRRLSPEAACFLADGNGPGCAMAAVLSGMKSAEQARQEFWAFLLVHLLLEKDGFFDPDAALASLVRQAAAHQGIPEATLRQRLARTGVTLPAPASDPADGRPDRPGHPPSGLQPSRRWPGRQAFAALACRNFALPGPWQTRTGLPGRTQPSRRFEAKTRLASSSPLLLQALAAITTDPRQPGDTDDAIPAWQANSPGQPLTPPPPSTERRDPPGRPLIEAHAPSELRSRIHALLAYRAGPGAEAPTMFLAALEEHAARTAHPGPFLASVLKALEQGTEVDMEALARDLPSKPPPRPASHGEASSFPGPRGRERPPSGPPYARRRALANAPSVFGPLSGNAPGKPPHDLRPANTLRLARELERLLRGPADRLLARLRRLGGARAGTDINAVRHLARRLAPLPEGLMARVLHRLRGGEQQALLACAGLITGAWQRAGLPEPREGLNARTWAFILGPWLGHGLAFRPALFARQLVALLGDARPGTGASARIAARLGHALPKVAGPVGTSLTRTLALALEAALEVDQDAPSLIFTAPLVFAAPTAGGESERTTGDGPGTGPALPAVATHWPMPDGDADGPHYIDNAGLVLASPWFPRLFSMLGLTIDDSFVDGAAAERGVHLLQYLVDGGEGTPEHQLILNKLLCGLALDLPIPRQVPLATQEMAAAESLLRAMLQYWTHLGKTSVAGLRDSFLLREGSLRRKDEAWHLRVAPKAYDMLLDSLPWSIAVIRHRWMAVPLHVTWR